MASLEICDMCGKAMPKAPSNGWHDHVDISLQIYRATDPQEYACENLDICLSCFESSFPFFKMLSATSKRVAIVEEAKKATPSFQDELETYMKEIKAKQGDDEIELDPFG